MCKWYSASQVSLSLRFPRRPPVGGPLAVCFEVRPLCLSGPPGALPHSYQRPLGAVAAREPDKTSSRVPSGGLHAKSHLQASPRLKPMEPSRDVGVVGTSDGDSPPILPCHVRCQEPDSTPSDEDATPPTSPCESTALGCGYEDGEGAGARAGGLHCLVLRVYGWARPTWDVCPPSLSPF